MAVEQMSPFGKLLCVMRGECEARCRTPEEIVKHHKEYLKPGLLEQFFTLGLAATGYHDELIEHLESAQGCFEAQGLVDKAQRFSVHIEYYKAKLDRMGRMPRGMFN